MSILTKNAIAQDIEKGTIRVEPSLDPTQIREASIDLRLDKTFRIFKQTSQPIPLLEQTDYRDYTDEIISETFLVNPQETVLGVTMEKITLPGNICAWIEGRSRFARLGLLIHISAGLIQPGISNHQVLEITNLGPNVLELHAGERICQLVFQRTEGEALYSGRFQGQTKP
ncbi:MAG TPA: dCTP deaminase [Candidatus Saccharimonadales bacterium]|nr:dCTP deaminase [Candidatus Saccharimonadales bacterium]